MICKRCKGTGFDPDIDMPGSCDHSGVAPKRIPRHLIHMHKVFNRPLPELRRATVSWQDSVEVKKRLKKS